MSRLPVKKTYKLFIGGAFPRSESGRTYEAEGQNVARASRKDVRDAVRAARGALPKWAGMTAYNRGQVLYRIAEMIEARRAEFAELCTGRDEVERSDRSHRLVRRLGGQARAGARLARTPSPARTSTSPCPSRPASSASSRPTSRRCSGSSRASLPALVGGNAVVALASETHPLAAIELAEALATSDVPGGVVNILTGHRDRARAVARLAHGRQRDRPHRRRRRLARARACRRGQRQARRPRQRGHARAPGRSPRSSS